MWKAMFALHSSELEPRHSQRPGPGRGAAGGPRSTDQLHRGWEAATHERQLRGERRSSDQLHGQGKAATHGASCVGSGDRARSAACTVSATCLARVRHFQPRVCVQTIQHHVTPCEFLTSQVPLHTDASHARDMRRREPCAASHALTLGSTISRRRISHSASDLPPSMFMWRGDSFGGSGMYVEWTTTRGCHGGCSHRGYRTAGRVVRRV